MQHWAKSTLLATLLTLSVTAQASGIQPWMQSAGSLSDTGAGAAARIDNPDISYYNPAAMPWIQGQDMGLSLIATVNNVKYKGVITPSPAVTGFEGSSGAQGGEVSYLPNLFYVAPLSKKWGFGLAITSPQHYTLDYDDNSPARYIVSDWYLRSTDISPSLGFRFIRSVSVGAGIDFEYTDIRFRQVSNLGTTASDTPSKTSIDDWGYGWNAGAVWQPFTFSRIGISYHSSIYHKSVGSSTYPSRSRAKARYHLPSMTILSGDITITSQLELLGSIVYTHWRQMDDLKITNIQSMSGTTDNLLFTKLKNSWLFSVGGHYLITPALTLKTGFGYDEGAISDRYRNLVLPDGSHYIASVGLNYQINRSFNLDLGYSHYFNHDLTIQQSQTYGTTTVTTDGRVSTNTDLFGVQLNWLMT